MSIEAAPRLDHVVNVEDQAAMQRAHFRLPLDHIVQLNEYAFAEGATRVSDLLRQALEEFHEADDDTRQSYLLQTNDTNDGTERDVTAEVNYEHLIAMNEATERYGLYPSVPFRAAVRYFFQQRLLRRQSDYDTSEQAAL